MQGDHSRQAVVVRSAMFDNLSHSLEKAWDLVRLPPLLLPQSLVGGEGG